MARPKEYQEEHVLNAIMNVFWSQGYEATSAQDLVEATGLTRSSLYNAYVNKRGLFEQALIHYKQCTAQHVEYLNKSDSVTEAIHTLLIDIVKYDISQPENRGCLITNTAIEQANQDERAAQLVCQNFRMLEEALEKNILRAQQSGDINSTTNAKILAACILNTVQGLRVLSKAKPANYQKMLSSIVSTTLAALLK